MSEREKNLEAALHFVQSIFEQTDEGRVVAAMALKFAPNDPDESSVGTVVRNALAPVATGSAGRCWENGQETRAMTSDVFYAQGAANSTGDSEACQNADAELWRFGVRTGVITPEMQQRISFAWGNGVDD